MRTTIDPSRTPPMVLSTAIPLSRSYRLLQIVSHKGPLPIVAVETAAATATAPTAAEPHLRREVWVVDHHSGGPAGWGVHCATRRASVPLLQQQRRHRRLPLCRHPQPGPAPTTRLHAVVGLTPWSTGGAMTRHRFVLRARPRCAERPARRPLPRASSAPPHRRYRSDHGH